jgi:general secretion pathway protein G
MMKTAHRTNVRHGHQAASRRGFTLVEILIVVIILGILAAIVVPAFSNAATQSRENMLKEDLRMIRQQTNSYRAQHNDVSPGCDTAGNWVSLDTFVAHMTKYSNMDGQTNDVRTDVFCYGPYMSQIPVNTINHLDTISVVNNGVDMTAATAGNESGWLYKPENCTWRAGVAGNDTNGQAFFSY